MAFEVVMPRLGWTMEVGTLVEWKKKDGETVQAGEILFSVESDKALTEVEALESGILRIPPNSPPPGEQAPVGALLAYLVQPGEPPPFDAHGDLVRSTADDLATAASPSPSVHAQAGSAVQRSDGAAPYASPRARRAATELGVDWTTLKGSGRAGRIVERDVRQAAAHARPAVEIRVSPLARRRADETGIDLEQLASRMPGRRITQQDVEVALRQQTVAEPAMTAADRLEFEPLSSTRREIRDRMVAATQTAAAVTLLSDADATELVTLRGRMVSVALENGRLRPPTYNDLLIRLVACALLEHPDLNSSLKEDTLVRHADVHIGLAVDTPRGLLVPVIRNAHQRGIWEIAEESARLISEARLGSIASEDIRGSTFTITNLGGLEVDAFTPILNLPECAILGVGKIALRPAVDTSGQRVVPRQTVTLSLTFDHRVVDGAPAARFLKRLKHFIEEPLSWLAS